MTLRQQGETLSVQQYDAPLGPLLPCIDCDRNMRECVCENVLRCSCGIPDEVCVCAGKMS